MTTTPRLGAPELVSAQAAPETTVNEQIRTVEQGAGYFIVKDKDLTAPPGSPVDGDAYIVAATATGAWAGKEKKIAFRMSTGWLYVTPIEGTAAYVQDENLRYLFDGSSWAPDASGSSASLGYIVGVAMIGTASAGEVLSLHAVGRAFTIPANFGSGALEVLKGANPAATADIIIEKSTDGGATWSTVGTISVSTSGTVTATTAGGAAIAFSKGHGLRAKAPASADATFASWAFTIIGA